MKNHFDKISATCSKMITRSYSTSFSLGIYFLNNTLHEPIYSIYGYVRCADEIVDSFDGYNQKHLLQKFRTDTYDALENKISLNPVLNAFQKVVHEYKIGLDLIDAFLHSMEMDLEKVYYSKEKYEEYIYGSAEVVGLMCLCVFTNGQKEIFEELKPYAMKLGAAFQKVNFLRDMKQDYHDLGRIYFPNVNMDSFSAETKKQIEDEISADFKEALIGIQKLPDSSKRGVYLAYVYYTALLKKIKNVPSQSIMSTRIRINNGQKIMLMLNSLFQYKFDLI